MNKRCKILIELNYDLEERAFALDQELDANWFTSDEFADEVRNDIHDILRHGDVLDFASVEITDALELRDVKIKWTGEHYPATTMRTTVAIGQYREDQPENDDDIFYYFSSEDELESAYSQDWAESNDFVLVKEGK